MPEDDAYGVWPRSGEINIAECRGNNYSYPAGRNFMFSTLRWMPSYQHDAYMKTHGISYLRRRDFAEDFHTFGLIWTEKYLFMYLDNPLKQVSCTKLYTPLWKESGFFGLTTEKGTLFSEPWVGARKNAPFDQKTLLDPECRCCRTGASAKFVRFFRTITRETPTQEPIWGLKDGRTDAMAVLSCTHRYCLIYFQTPFQKATGVSMKRPSTLSQHSSSLYPLRNKINSGARLIHQTLWSEILFPEPCAITSRPLWRQTPSHTLCLRISITILIRAQSRLGRTDAHAWTSIVFSASAHASASAGGIIQAVAAVGVAGTVDWTTYGLGCCGLRWRRWASWWRRLDCLGRGGGQHGAAEEEKGGGKVGEGDHCVGSKCKKRSKGID